MARWPFSRKATTEEVPSGDNAPQVEPALLKAEKETEQVYKREVWWLDHRMSLKKAGIISVIVLEVLIGLIGIWAFVDYYLIDFVAERQMTTSIIEGAEALASATREQQPIELDISDPRTVQSGARFDILSIVENTNPNWNAELTFHFEYAGDVTESQTVVVNQDTKLALTELAIEGTRVRSAEVVVDNVDWQRIDTHVIDNPLMWKKERWNLDFGEVAHRNDLVIGSKTFGRTTFVIENNAGYGFYDVPITIVLERGGSLIGVNKTTISQLKALSDTPVQIDWFDTAPSASSIDIYPEINLFDESMYIPTSADEELDIRDTIRRR